MKGLGMTGAAQQIVEDDDEDLTEDELDQLVDEWIIEGMLCGALPCGDLEFSQLTQVGLELGIVVRCEGNVLALARDVEIEEQVQERALVLSQQQQSRGLELGTVGSSVKYAANFGRAFQSGNQRAAGSLLKTAKRTGAKMLGRAKTGLRTGMQAAGESARPLADAGIRTLRQTGSLAKKHPAATFGAGALAGGGVANALTANADARREKAKR